MKSVTAVEDGEKQRKGVNLRLLASAVALLIVALALGGCRYPVKGAAFVEEKLTDLIYLGSGDEFAYPGETEAEARRRHKRVERINSQLLRSDLDRALLLDRPSALTDRRIP